MASPGQLVDAVAKALGVPQPTVKVHDYNLSVAGYRAKGGRGRSAAKMTPRDAAFLLTAVLGADQVKDSVVPIERYSATRVFKNVFDDDPRPRHQGWEAFAVPELAALPQDHNFLDALEALISSAVSGSLMQALVDNAFELKGKKFPFALPTTRVAVRSPTPFGEISIVLLGGPGRSRGVNYALPGLGEEINFAMDVAKYREVWGHLDPGSVADLKQYREISEATIFSVAKVLKA